MWPKHELKVLQMLTKILHDRQGMSQKLHRAQGMVFKTNSAGYKTGKGFEGGGGKRDTLQKRGERQEKGWKAVVKGQLKEPRDPTQK